MLRRTTGQSMTAALPSMKAWQDEWTKPGAEGGMSATVLGSWSEFATSLQPPCNLLATSLQPPSFNFLLKTLLHSILLHSTLSHSTLSLSTLLATLLLSTPSNPLTPSTPSILHFFPFNFSLQFLSPSIFFFFNFFSSLCFLHIVSFIMFPSVVSFNYFSPASKFLYPFKCFIPSNVLSLQFFFFP